MPFESINTTTAEQVIQVIAQDLRLRPETVQATDDFVRDLGTDSLDKLGLIIALEDAFRLRINRDTENFDTVQDLIDITLAAPKNMHPSALRKELRKGKG